MPYRITFQNGEIYHITVRRIGEQLLFKDLDDHYRGIFSIYEFNNSDSVNIRDCRHLRRNDNKTVRVVRVRDSDAKKRDLLVEVLAFCLMPNHLHLLLRQLQEGGISKYMNKFGSGYSGYFKKKHSQKGTGYFFQGRFKGVHIEDDNQLRTVFVYIHTNPVALVESNWKEKGIGEPEKVIKFLENYKWSSYQDYIEKKNFPSVTERKFLSEVMGGPKKCKEFVDEWVKYKAEIRQFAELSLEE